VVYITQNGLALETQVWDWRTGHVLLKSLLWYLLLGDIDLLILSLAVGDATVI